MGDDYVTLDQLDPRIFATTKREIYLFMVVVLVGCIFSVASVVMWGYTKATERTDWNCNNNGHRFSGRYEDVGPNKDVIETIGKVLTHYDSYRLKAIEKSKTRHYICDVCEYCGLVVRNNNGTQAEDNH